MQRSAVAALFLFASVTELYAADLAFARAVEAAKASSIIPGHIVETAQSGCETALCFAETLVARLPGRVRLEPVIHPDTDTVRWVTTMPSVIADDTGDTLKLKLTHFGRKALPELRAALAIPGRHAIELDVSGNPGGDFERMLSIAGFLLGPLRDAVEIHHGDRIERRSLQGPTTRTWQVVSVETDSGTASAALLLVHLLTAHGGAKRIGPFVGEKPIFLKRRMSIDHDWRLILPVAEVSIAMP